MSRRDTQTDNHKRKPPISKGILAFVYHWVFQSINFSRKQKGIPSKILCSERVFLNEVRLPSTSDESKYKSLNTRTGTIEWRL